MPMISRTAMLPTTSIATIRSLGDSHVGTRGVKDPLQIFPTLGGAFKPGEQLSQFPATSDDAGHTAFRRLVMKGPHRRMRK